MMKQRNKCNHKKVTDNWKKRRSRIVKDRLDKMMIAKERQDEHGREQATR